MAAGAAVSMGGPGAAVHTVAVVLNWNGAHDTVACVHSLQAQTQQALCIVVIDNGSTDGSESFLRSHLAGVEIIQSGRNLGFGGGCNIGLRQAMQQGAQYVWLINNDATASPETLQSMVAMAESEQGLGAVGAVIHDAAGAQQVQCWGGGVVNTWLGRSRPNLQPGPLDYLTGACLLLRVEALKQVGLFDEQRYFMYWEDVDLSFRLRRAGWGLGVAAQTCVWHEASSSLGKWSPLSDRYATCSVVRFLRRYASFPALSISLNIATRMMARLARGQWRRLAAVYRGYQDA